METFHFDYPATEPVRHRTHVGVVGSGDLEVLLEPSADEMAHVTIRPTGDGCSSTGTSVGREQAMIRANRLDSERFLRRKSFIELRARERALALLDHGTFRELLGPFDRLESPWLSEQGVVPQTDDGLVVARGTLAGKDSA